MNSFRDTILPTSCASNIENLNHGIFSRIFDRSKKLIYNLNSSCFADLATTTIGFSKLQIDAIPDIEIFITSPNFTETENLSQSTTRRLGWVRWLVENDYCKIYTKGKMNNAEKSCSNVFQSTVALAYSDSDYIAYQIYRTAGNEYAVNLYWPYGDPEQIAVKSCAEYSEIVNSCKKLDISASLLTNIRKEAPPFYELESSHKKGLPQLFEHQQRAVDEWFKNNFRGIFDMCTGAGKTITSLACLERLMNTKDGPDVYLITVPTRVLADQWCTVLSEVDFPAPIKVYNSFKNYASDLSNGLEFSCPDEPLFIVSTYKSFRDERIQNEFHVASRKYRKKCCWVADEAHNLAPSSMLRILRDQVNFFTHRLALSATPEVEGNDDATDRIFNFFGGIIARYELKNGIEDKVLCPYRYFPFPYFLDETTSIQYLNLMKRIADNEDAKAIDISLYTERRNLMRQSGAQIWAFKELLPKILERNPDLSHTLVYCPSGYQGVDRAEDDSTHEDSDQNRLIASAVETIRSHGSSATSILGSTNASERDEFIENFKNQKIDCLCAIGCLDEGIDIPSIQRAIVLASVDRKKQFIQRRGRILRKSLCGDPKIADIWDVILLPQNNSICDSKAEAILARELRRYQEFSELAMNRDEASAKISHLL